jgi:hypothetical protein
LILKCHIPQIIMFSSTVFLLHTFYHNYISTIKKYSFRNSNWNIDFSKW